MLHSTPCNVCTLKYKAGSMCISLYDVFVDYILLIIVDYTFSSHSPQFNL